MLEKLKTSVLLIIARLIGVRAYRIEGDFVEEGGSVHRPLCDVLINPRIEEVSVDTAYARADYLDQLMLSRYTNKILKPISILKYMHNNIWFYI